MNNYAIALTQFRHFSEEVTKNYELLQTEVILLNKLLFCEQKFSKHLNTVFDLYEELLYDIQQNDHNLTARNQLEEQKSIAKQNKTEVKKLRQELKTWRQNNHRFNDNITDTEELSSSAPVLNEEIPEIKCETNDRNGSQIGSEDEELNSELIESDFEELVSKNREFDNSCQSLQVSNAEQNSTETRFSEETNDFIQNNNICVTHNEESNTGSSESSSSNPFSFVSEYLSQNQNSNQLKYKNKRNSSNVSQNNSNTQKSSNGVKGLKYCKIDDNLKELIIKNMNNGMTGKDVGLLFDIKPNSVRAVYRRYLSTGQFKTQKKGCRRHKLTEEQRKVVSEWFEQNSTLTLKDLKVKCVEKWPQLGYISANTISKAIKEFHSSGGAHNKQEILFRRRLFLKKQMESNS